MALLKTDHIIKTLNIKSRSIAYSIERMLLYSFKDLNIFALNNRIKTLISLFK
ncbi:hypothetical protein vBKpMFBKp34_038 [Klebsiella phage vB_KpM_FBKp34]|nr:hypothetical protein vBKpMFBKp34_038 [Klebsiella phage vB_KpM_FBKp34]